MASHSQYTDMSDYDALLRRVQREEIALFCLGRKGEHFVGDEWERRADALQASPGRYLTGQEDAS